MITSNFSGNFGNAIIQYAVTRTVADKNNYEFGFNPKFNYDYHNGYNQLDFLDLDYGIIHNASFHENPYGIDKVWFEKYETIKYSNGDTVDWHKFQPEVFDIENNTKLVIRCMQDARYFNRDKLKKWIKILPEKEKEYQHQLDEAEIKLLDKNFCLINCRGGEYKPLSHVLLQKKYWNDAINYMRNYKDDMEFVVVTDDVEYAKSIFDFPVIHFGIGCDYYMLNRAKNLIISNSSFAIIPTWLNENNPFVIAPRHWARHNVSTGYWASSDIWTFHWTYLDRNGELYAK